MKRAIRIFVTSLLPALMVNPARAAECLGVTLPDKFQQGNESLVLNGLGARLATMVKIKVYVAGLYPDAALETKSENRQRLPKNGDLKKSPPEPYRLLTAGGLISVLSRVLRP